MSVRPDEDNDARFVWATRGRTWGFRFLHRGGFEDPLSVYEDAFSGIGDQGEAWSRTAGSVALRFPDPEQRRDASGRVIPHDFVLLGSWAEGVNSLEDGRRRIWPEVSEEFRRVWELEQPPTAAG